VIPRYQETEKRITIIDKYQCKIFVILTFILIYSMINLLLSDPSF